MPEQNANRLWLWIVIGIGLLVTVLAALAALAFVTLPMILQQTGSKPAGAVLTYEVDPDSLPPGVTVNMESLTAAVNRRLNPGRGWNKVAQVRGLDDRRIEVALIRQDEPETERVKQLLGRIGSLEFRILANTRDNKELIERALADPSKMFVTDKTGRIAAWWVPVAAAEERTLAAYSGIAARKRKHGNREALEILVRKDIYDVTGAYLTRVSAGTEPNGKPCISFTFSSVGGQLFGRLTSSHLPDPQSDFTYKLAIILDGEIYSAPAIRSTITDRAQITGNFTAQEVQDLVNVFNSGAFPARIRLVGKKEKKSP
jgi:preprotein translocase subunit SecD